MCWPCWQPGRWITLTPRDFSPFDKLRARHFEAEKIYISLCAKLNDMSAQRGSTQLILVFAVVLVAGLTGLFLLNKQRDSLSTPLEQQNQPRQNKNSSNQPQEGYGFKQPFYDKDGIALQHYWPGDGSFSNEETEILLFNEGASDLQVKSYDLVYSVDGKTYPHKSGTWEKFPSEQSWDRMEYINISPQYYKSEPLILTPGQKGKLHWHINFGSQPLDGKQAVSIKLTLFKDGKSVSIEQSFIRDSGIVVSKGDH